MGLSVARNQAVAVVFIISFLLLAGCTDEDINKAFQDSVKQSIHDQVKNATGIDAGGLINASVDLLNQTGALNIANGNETGGGECRFDSNCAALCEGNTYWKRGCDAQANKCAKTFDYDCGQKMTAVGEFSFVQTCTPSGCTDDTGAIHAKKEDLVASANRYSAAMQQTTALRQIASKNCIGALADVTNRLIVETAVSMSSPTSSAVGLWTDTTKQAVETLGTANSEKMSAEEFISLNCNAVKSLDMDYALLSKKRDLVMAQAEAFAGR